MTDFPEGAPCWADATFSDLEGAKRFYGEVLGWTFGENAPEYGGYTQAFSDGKAVAALSPPMPGSEDSAGPAEWCLYLASPDTAATVRKVAAAGGEVLTDTMKVGDFGTLAIARMPDGASFGVWQPEQHRGFDKQGEPGAYIWAEVVTRDADAVDAFLPAVFPYEVQGVADEHVDFKVFSAGGKDRPALGRMRFGEGDLPKDVSPYVNVYFAVADCDAAVKKAVDAGAKLRFGPTSSPYGRFAALRDPQGAGFSVIDPATREGATPRMTDA